MFGFNLPSLSVALQGTRTLLLALLLVVVMGSAASWAFHDAKSDRIYDLNEPWDETTIQNMTPAEQRVLLEAQHPGISKWNQWRVMERHPDTGAIIACRRYSKYNCKEFASPDDYQRYLIYEFEGHQRRRYGYLKRHYVYPQTYQPSAPQARMSPAPSYESPSSQVTTTFGGNQWEDFDQ